MSTFSIVIPLYKVAKGTNADHFRALVRSLEQASVRAGIERLQRLVLVNDNPGDLIDPFLADAFRGSVLEAKLHVFHNPKNIGQAQSRNVGYGLTRSDYVHFIDQDDFVNAEFYAALTAHDADVLLARADLYIDKAKLVFPYMMPHTMAIFRRARRMRDLTWFLLSSIAPSPGQCLIRRSALDQVGGFPNLAAKGADDYGLWFLLVASDPSFRFVSEAVFLHRLHGTQGRTFLDLHRSQQEFFDGLAGRTLPGRLSLIRRVKQSPALSRLGKLHSVAFFRRYTG